MTSKFLLTAFSKDRPGIVADLSRVIYENGYNLEESSMANLADEFAILLLLSTSSTNGDEAQKRLTMECRRLEIEKGITAYIRPVTLEEPKKKSDTVTKSIHVEGVDQAGIVCKVSGYLADKNINITTLTSEIKKSPESGTAMYLMEIVIEIPSNLSLQTIEDELAQIGDQLNVDVALE